MLNIINGAGSMSLWKSIFPQGKPIIGMVHVQALPGTPGNNLTLSQIMELAVNEAIVYEKYNLDAIMLENMHDLPYLNKCVGPEITASMSAISLAVRQAVKVPVGIQILAAANKEALAVALAAGLQFIRAEGFVFGHVADEGYMDSCAGELLRYRKSIGADHIAILTDIKKKHSAHSITADVSIGETASAAEFFLSDGLVVTGKATGKEVLSDDLAETRNQSSLPVIIGSGITAENISRYWSLADGFIIGSYFKKEGLWSNPISEQRIREITDAVSRLTS
jgi:membrane complex biogenesis BtpA family protein